MPINLLSFLGSILKGTHADDVISGLAGDDLLAGEGGSDRIDGGEGNDTLFGDSGEGTSIGQDATALTMNSDALDSTSYSGDNAGVGDYAVYRDVATLEDGTKVWGRLVLESKSDPNMSVDLAGSSGAEILMNGHGMGDTAEFRLEFFDPDTNAPIAINSIATFNDLDQSRNGDDEAVHLDADSFEGIEISQDSSLVIDETGDSVRISGTEGNAPTDEDAWVSAGFSNKTSIRFTLEARDTDSGFTLSGDLITDAVHIEFEAGSDTISGGIGDDVVFGQGGNDVLDGDEGNDLLDGGAGADIVEGGAGDDTILGGTGDDTLSGGDGNDFIQGGLGNDYMTTGLGNDTLLGGEGDDTLRNSAGDDSLDGGEGDDSIVATEGNDTLLGGDGNDTMSGGVDNDLLDGGAGNDHMEGEAGQDSLIGGAGNDYMSGGDGDDTLSGGADDDLLVGGEGDDVFSYIPGDGHDTIADFNSGNTGPLGDGDSSNNDSIDLSGFYDNMSELRADYADDNTLNQSNATDAKGRAVDYSDNSQFGDDGSLTFKGGSAEDDFFSADNTGVVCFAQGTKISTPNGDRLIESLQIGDAVQTRDNGPQRIIWIGRRQLDSRALAANPKLVPVRIAPELIDADAPLLVSPQHGVLLTVDGNETLVRAIHLARMHGGKARIAHGCRSVMYVHLMFEKHEIIMANGAPSESFFPGAQATAALGYAARQELAQLFPELPERAALDVYGPMVRNYAMWKRLPCSLKELKPI